MQYLLTKEELDDLVSKSKSEAEIAELKTAIEACRLLILKLSGHACQGSYCCSCPVSSIGSWPKDLSRIEDLNGIEAYKISRTVCGLHRQYSK